MIKFIAKCANCHWQLSMGVSAPPSEAKQILIAAQVHVNRTDHTINIIGSVKAEDE